MAAPGLDITPQMREAIMRGQKAFKRGGRTLGNNAIDEEAAQKALKKQKFSYGGTVDDHALNLVRRHLDHEDDHAA